MHPPHTPSINHPLPPLQTPWPELPSPSNSPPRPSSASLATTQLTRACNRNITDCQLHKSYFLQGAGQANPQPRRVRTGVRGRGSEEGETSRDGGPSMSLGEGAGLSVSQSIQCNRYWGRAGLCQPGGVSIQWGRGRV